MTLLNVRHLTTYNYKRPVGFGEHRVLFRPRDSQDQRLLKATMDISPTPESVRWIHDVFGNSVAIVDFGDREADTLRFETNISLDHTPWAGPELTMEERARTYPFAYDADEQIDLAPVIRRAVSDQAGQVDAWVRRFLKQGPTTDTGHLLMTMTYAIKEGFSYLRRPDPGTQSPLMTLERRQGTCRDFAYLMIEAARSLGFAARFVTGYIYVPSRDGSTNRGGGSTHAWCEIYLPGAGWVEFDPTNGIIGNRDLIRVGVAREPRQARPLVGSFVGKSTDYKDMTVQVNVTRTEEAVAA